MLNPWHFPRQYTLMKLAFTVSDKAFASYASNNTPYFKGKDIDKVIQSLENESLKIFRWFKLKD